MNKLKLLSTLVAVTLFSVVSLNSCKDDDEPAPRPKVGFASSNIEVNEDHGTLEVEVRLDGAAPEDIVVEYSVAGTATRRTSSNTASADYSITGTVGEVEIRQGQTSGVISISIINDGIYEENETIILKIEDVDSDRVDFGERTQTTITIVSDDAAMIASFAAGTLTVKESEPGVHELMVNLDKVATSDVVVTYQLSPWSNGQQGIQGAAIDSLRAYEAQLPSDYYDYYIDGVSGQLTVPAGQQSAAIRMNVLSDFRFEGTETVELTITASPGITPGQTSKMVVTIQQEDGRVVELDWAPNTNADMDLWLWLKTNETGPDWVPFTFAIVGSTTGPEQRFIPNSIVNGFAAQGVTTVDFGISAIYYSGTVDPLQFVIAIVDFENGAVEPEANWEVKEGTYGVVNINPWDNEANGTEPIVIQQFQWTSASGYGAASEITIPAQRSRVGTAIIPEHLKRQKKATQLKQFRKLN